MRIQKMSNAWEQINWIGAKSLNVLSDSLVLKNACAFDNTSDFNVKPNGYSVGSTVEIRTNPAYEAKEFTTTTETQDIRSSVRSMSIEKHFDVTVELGAKEKKMDMDNFYLQVVRPAVTALSQKVESYLGTKILDGAGLYSSDSLFGSAADMALATEAATVQQLSPTGRFCVVNGALRAKLLGETYFNTFNSRGQSGESVFNTGGLGQAFDMDFVSSLYMPSLTFTAGTGVGVTNNGSGANNLVGTKTITTTATTVGTIKAGDRIKIAGVRRPLRISTLANVGATSILLTDPITEIIPDGAAITVVSSGATYDIQGAIFDDASLAIAMPMLDNAAGHENSVVSENGVSIRVVQGYDMGTKTHQMSFDLIVGASAYDNRRITLIGDNA